MQSLFYPSDDPILPFLFYEALAKAHSSNPEIEIGEAITFAYKLCHDKKPPISVQEQIAERLEAEHKELQAKKEKEEDKFVHPWAKKLQAADQEKGSKRKGYGGFLLDWMGGLDAAGMCLFLAGFDMEKARALYCKEDRAVVLRAVELKSIYTWEQARAAHEAVLFGMGGGYKGHMQDPDAVDLVNEPEPTAKLKALGLMH